MNKLFTKVAALSVGLAMAVGVGVGLGSKASVRSVKADSTFKIEFKDNGTASDGSSDQGATPDVSNVVAAGTDYVASFSGCSKLYLGKTGYGIKIGASGNPGTVNFTLASGFQNNIKSIKVVSAQYGSDTGTLTLYNGSTALQSGITPGTDYTHTFSSATTVPSVKLTTSAKRAYILSVEFTMEGSIAAADRITFKDNGSDSSSEFTASTALSYVAKGATLIDSFSGISKAYPGTVGVKFGSSGASGTLTVNLKSGLSLSGATLYATIKQYGSDTGTLNFSSTGFSGTISKSPTSTATEVEVATFTSEPSSITVGTSAKRGYLLELRFDSSGGETVAVTGVSLNKNSTTLSIGDEETLVATVAPADATNKSVTWSSSDDAVASVSSSGTVTAVAAGTADITVTTVDGDFTATCEVTVSTASYINTTGYTDGGSYYIYDGTYYLRAVDSSTQPERVTTPALATVFTITLVGNDTFTFVSDGSYLYATNANNGVRFGSTSDSWNLVSTTGGFTFQDTSSSRYLSSTGETGKWPNGDWRSYQNTNTGNCVLTLVQYVEKTVTALSVSPNSWTGYTSGVIDVSDYTVSVTTNGSAGTSQDYTFQGIGSGSGDQFVARDASFTSGNPTTSDTRLQWKANYPTTSGGSTFLYAYVSLTVTADSVSSISASIDEGTYYAGEKLDASVFNVTANWASGSTTYPTSGFTWTVNGDDDGELDVGSNTIVVTYEGQSSSNISLTTSGYRKGSFNNPYTVAEAIDAVDHETGVNDVHVTGIVSEIVEEYSTQYSNITFNFSSDGSTESAQFQAFRCNGTEASLVSVGDEVIVRGNLILYNETIYELTSGCTLVNRVSQWAFDSLELTASSEYSGVFYLNGTFSSTGLTVTYNEINTNTSGTRSTDVTSSATFNYDLTTVGSNKNLTATYDGHTSNAVKYKVIEQPDFDIIFGNENVKINAASVTDSTSGWTVTTEGTTSFTNTAGSGFSQIGSSSKPATSITFTKTISSVVTLKQFFIKLGGFNNTVGTVTLKVDNTTVGTGSLNGTNDVIVSASSVARGGATAGQTTLTITITGIDKGVKAYGIAIEAKTDTEMVTDFVNDYMHMDHTTNDGSCKTQGWYVEAKAAYGDMHAEQKTLFNTSSTFAAARERLIAWAVANGESFDPSNGTFAANPRIAIFGQNGVDTDTTLIVIIASVVAVAAVGGYFFLRRKKEQ